MISKYRLTHLFVTFNIGSPKFKRTLLKIGFMKFDTHTYFRPTSPTKVEEILTAVDMAVPHAATVRVIRITDKQWTDAKVYSRGKHTQWENR